MGRKLRTYSRLPEASEMINKLCEKHADAFWCVVPESIVVMGIDNCARGEKAVKKSPLWSKMRNVKGVERAMFKENDIKERFIIEVYCKDWNDWSDSVRYAVLANHLFEMTDEAEVKNRPDCIGFKILFDVLGVNWQKDLNSIPNLITSDIKFNSDLRPGLENLEFVEKEV